MRPPLNDHDKHRLRRFWAAQMPDADIARRLNATRRLVGMWRKRLGLPSWFRGSPTPQGRERIRAALRANLARFGVTTLVKLRPDYAEQRRRELASRYGLPEDLHIRETEILLVLASGPATATAIAERLRLRLEPGGYKSFNAPCAGGGNYLTALARRGLIVRVPVSRGKGNRSGRGASQYMLTPAAMDMLASNKEKAQ